MGGGGAWNWSAVMRVNRMPTPSIRASRTPPIRAEPAMAGNPLRAAKMPPVAAPEIIEFQGSSFFRKCTSVQSMVLNMPPHTAKLPARMGERVLTADKLPICNGRAWGQDWV